MATAIVEGRVLITDSRSGTKVTDGVGRPWTINTARVLVADTDVTEVTYDPSTDGALRAGDEVRALVAVSTYRGEPSFRVVPGHLSVLAPESV